MTFHAELSADMYRHWNTSSHGCSHALSPSVMPVTLINSVQESFDHCDTSNIYQTGIVSDEELCDFINKLDIT